ncbi:MAG: HupE/UreJ family protein [Pseudomonadota bacterium]
MRSGLALGLALVALPAPAEAHLVGTEFGDFYAGALHLLSGPEYLALLLGLAVVVAASPPEAGRWSLAALPLALVPGAVAGLLGDPLAGAEAYLAGVIALTGGLGVLARALPGPALAALAAAAGGLIGYENARPGAVAGIDPLIYGAGVVATGTVVGTLAIAFATHYRDWKIWATMAQRALGSWIAAVGMLFLAVTLL